MEDREALEDALCDHAELDVAVAGGELAAHLVAVLIGFAVEILVAGAQGATFHGGHPEVVAAKGAAN